MTPLEKAARALALVFYSRGPGISQSTIDPVELADANWDMFVPQARAALLAMREPDEAFMWSLYPDPICDGRPMTKQGERSRRAGRMQIAHFIDHVLESGG